MEKEKREIADWFGEKKKRLTSNATERFVVRLERKGMVDDVILSGMNDLCLSTSGGGARLRQT